MTLEDQQAILHQMAKTPPDVIHKTLANLVIGGHLQAHEAVSVLGKIQQTKDDDEKKAIKDIEDNKDKIKDPIADAKDSIIKSNPEGIKNPILENAVKDPDKLNSFLKDLSEQANNSATAKDAINKHGVDLVGIANSVHPIETLPHISNKINDVVPAEDDESIGKKPVSSIIKPDKSIRTLDYGDYAKLNLPEHPIAKAEVKKQIEKGNEKIGDTGESFSAPVPGEDNKPFLNRILPRFQGILDKERPNTTLVTNSSVLKGYNVWDDMGRPSIKDMDPGQLKEFAKKYNEEKVDTGDLQSFDKVKGDPSQGQIHVIRHGETIDNQNDRFRSDDTNLTEEGIRQAGQAAANLKDKLDGAALPKIIASDLPRTIHTANIVYNVVNGKQPDPREVEVSNKEQPALAKKALSGSYDRLMEAGANPDDPDMKRMKDAINSLN